MISSAVDIQTKLERQGEPQGKINQAIFFELTGVDLGREIEGDLKSFMKYGALKEVGLYKPKPHLFARDPAAERIDQLIDSACRAKNLGPRS
jgi:hypothetical protein